MAKTSKSKVDWELEAAKYKRLWERSHVYEKRWEQLMKLIIEGLNDYSYRRDLGDWL